MKIDFLDELAALGFTPKVPREVLQELKDLKDKSRMPTRMVIDQLFLLLEKRNIKKIGLGSGAVDLQLIKHGKKGIFIATTDAGIRRTVPNRVIISSTDKKIVVERS